MASKGRRAKFAGRFTVGRYMNSDVVRIVFTDETSGCIALDAEMTTKDFAQALFGQAELPCEFLFNTSGVIGMQREHQRIVIPGIKPFGEKPENRQIAETFLAPYFAEGWEMQDWGDLDNGHNQRKGGQEVIIIRYVEREAKHGKV